MGEPASKTSVNLIYYNHPDIQKSSKSNIWQNEALYLAWNASGDLSAKDQIATANSAMTINSPSMTRLGRSICKYSLTQRVP